MPPRSSGPSSACPIEQAKAALQPYGEVVIDPWPSWVTSVPSLEQRVILTVGQPVEAASPGPHPPRPMRRRRARWRFPRARRRARSRRLRGRAGTIRRMSRILGIDLGERRIGLAVAESGIGGARPLSTIGRAKTIDADAEALARVCREQDVDGAGRRAADRGGGPGGHDGRGRPGVGRPRSARASRSRSRCATSGCPRSRPSGASGACRAGGRAARRRGPSATPIARGSIGRPPPSSSRTSWTPARRRGEHPQRSRSEAAHRPAAPDPGPPGGPLPAHGPVRPRARGPAPLRAVRRPPRRHRRDPALPPVPRACIAALVLVVMATVARPLLRAVVVPWAWDNPAALQLGFVSDLVREDLGAALTDPASSRPHDRGVRGPARRHAGQPRAAARGRRDHRQPAGVPVRGAAGRPDCRSSTPAGSRSP